ncbi:MAG: hypothetical protein WCJ59_03595 [bacterium]
MGQEGQLDFLKQMGLPEDKKTETPKVVIETGDEKTLTKPKEVIFNPDKLVDREYDVKLSQAYEDLHGRI